MLAFESGAIFCDISLVYMTSFFHLRTWSHQHKVKNVACRVLDIFISQQRVSLLL